MRTPEGTFEYPVFNDNMEIVREYEEGLIRDGNDVIYRGMICHVVSDFTDEDGLKYLELMVSDPIQGPVTFTVCG